MRIAVSHLAESAEPLPFFTASSEHLWIMADNLRPSENMALRYMVWVRNVLFLSAQLCELCGFATQTLAITSVLRPFNRRGTERTERTEDYGKIVGFLRQAHEPTENSDEPDFRYKDKTGGE